MLSNRQWWRKNVISYSLLFTAVSLVIFLPYVLSGTSLVWQSDGITQHLPALAQWQQDLKHLFATGNWPTQWNWHIGLGADYYQTFSYYTLGDIFSYGVGLVSAHHLLAYYEWMIIIRLFLAGAAMLWAIKYFTQSNHHWINAAISLAYVYTGYTAFSAFEHPFFINPLIILPLLAVSFDYLLSTRKMVPFTLMVFWTLWNNYYFAFMLFLGLGFYWIIKNTLQHTWLDWRMHLRVLISGLLGLIMSLVLFLPNVIGVLSSSRSGATVANGLTIYPVYYYLALPGTFLGNSATPNFWFTGGFASIFILGLIFTSLHWREYKTLASIWLLTGIGLLFPVFAAMFNGGSSPSNRWTFLLALPLALAAVHLLNHLDELSTRDWYWFYGVGFLMALSLFVVSGFSWQTPFGMLITIYVMTLLLLKIAQHTPQKKLTSGLVVVILINIVVIMGHTHLSDFDPDKTPMLSRASIQKLLKQQADYPTEHVSNTASLQRSLISDPLHNAEGIAPGNNLALLSSAHSIESYWSYQNGVTNRVMRDLGILTSNNNDVTSDLNSRTVVAHILGINQVFKNAPDLDIPNYDYGPELNYQTLGTSTSAYPLAYVPTNVVSPDTYRKASPTQREAMLADSVVSDALPNTHNTNEFVDSLVTSPISRQKTSDSANSLHYKYTTKADTDKLGIYVPANKKLQNTELHLELTNIRFVPQTFTESYQTDLDAYTFAKKEHETDKNTPDLRYNPSAFWFNWHKENIGQYGSNMGGYSITAKYNDVKQKFVQTSQKNLSFFNPRTSATINLGMANSVDETQFIPLTFSQPGTYEFDIQLVGVPTDRRFTDKARDAQEHAVPLKLDADHITGHFQSEGRQIISTSIPFSRGWSSENNELIEVNNGFLGMLTTDGENTIDLTYHTPGLKLGMYSSFIGFFLFIGLVIFEQRFISLLRKKKS